MYLWKCWRDTRVKFFVAFVIVLLLNFLPFVGAIYAQHLQKPGKVQNLLEAAFVFPAGLLWFFGWILSKDNVGADIGHGCGDFLLTRPASRGRLVWTGWMAGMVENIVLWIVISSVMYGIMLIELHLLGISVLSLPNTLVSFAFVFLLFAIFLLNLGMIYGLGYCIGVITRSGPWALIGSVIVLFGYGLLKSLLQHWNIDLPDFFLPLNTHHNQLEIPSTLAFVVHGCLLVAFPAVAHFALERMDV